MHLLLATSWLDPIVNIMSWIVLAINKPIGNLAISLIVLAALVRAVFWPLNNAQFKAMMAMQKIAPQMKKLQERFKDDKERLQKEQMALYKTHNANPLAGCLPMLVQYPVIISVYYVVTLHRNLYENSHFLWIGSALSAHWPKIFAASLAVPDVLMILIYMVTQYLSMRYTTMPPTDDAQAKQMKMMQFAMPVFFGFISFRSQWPSAMVLYWLSYNLFTMGQQLYLLRRYHEPISFIDADHAITDSVAAIPSVKSSSPKALQPAPSTNGARKRSGSKKKNKK